MPGHPKEAGQPGLGWICLLANKEHFSPGPRTKMLKIKIFKMAFHLKYFYSMSRYNKNDASKFRNPTFLTVHDESFQ